MRSMLPWRRIELAWVLLLLSIVGTSTLRCALSGSVVDQGRFETKLTDMRLKSYPTLRLYFGGSKREIPLKQINTIVIDPATTITIDNELYFGADITLKDGTRIKSLDKDGTKQTEAYLSVQNILVGKNENDLFMINLENVSRITVN